MTEHRVGRAVFAGFCGLSLVMLFMPASGVPSGIGLSDKVIHFSLFAAMVVSGRLAGLPLVPLAVGLAGYAVLSEVLQWVLPIDRDGDVRDVLADLTGVATGLVAVEIALRWRRGLE